MPNLSAAPSIDASIVVSKAEPTTISNIIGIKKKESPSGSIIQRKTM